MNIFLIPDVAYLFIVGGFLLAILALFAPGTGVIEIGAIFALLLGGYGAINQPINIWAVVILLIGVIPFVLAVRKSGKIIYLVVSIVALVVGSAYIFQNTVWYQPVVHPVLAFVVSTVAACFMWIVARKGLEALAIKPQNKLEELISASGETQTEINTLGGIVYAGGENWSARSLQPIPAHARVRVVKREGFILEVVEVPRSMPVSGPEKPANNPNSSVVSPG